MNNKHNPENKECLRNSTMEGQKDYAPCDCPEPKQEKCPKNSGYPCAILKSTERCMFCNRVMEIPTPTAPPEPHIAYSDMDFDDIMRTESFARKPTVTPERKDFVEEIEKLSEEIHHLYCAQYLKDHGEEYWTKGDYSKLDERVKEYDRNIARWSITRERTAYTQGAQDMLSRAKEAMPEERIPNGEMEGDFKWNDREFTDGFNCHHLLALSALKALTPTL